MCKTICKPPIIAFAISTLLIIVLLSLGLPFLFIPSALFVLGALATFSIVVIAIQSCCRRCEPPHPRPSGAEGCYCKKRVNWCCRIPIWFAMLLLLKTIALSLFVLEGCLVLGLIPLWILSFLTLTLLIDLL
ncbi:MAG: hypothetical protein LBU67_07880 [Oscillospiraceae bacterium]|jgi:hypothetical protein|nr:hypothetical protein [Oscillospiraceae bacterium]